jgi:hypothetical protein
VEFDPGRAPRCRRAPFLIDQRGAGQPKSEAARASATSPSASDTEIDLVALNASGPGDPAGLLQTLGSGAGP